MWGLAFRYGGRFVLGLAGAILLAAAVAALPASGLRAGEPGFLAAWAAHLAAMSRFDFGLSQVSALPAYAELARRLPFTLELVGAGALVAAVLGLPLGLLLGTGRRLRAAAPLIQVVAAAPVFCAGLALIWFARHVLGWDGNGPAAGSVWSALFAGHADAALAALRELALPALTVGAAGAAAVQLALRRAASQATEAPFRHGLRLMGLSGFEVDRAYLVPLILAGLLASLGEIALALLSAAAVAEWVFDWPGAAVLFVKSVALHDWGMAALVMLVFAAIKLTADLLGAFAAHALTRGEVAA